MKLLITDIFHSRDKLKRTSEMMSYLDNGYNIINYFSEIWKILAS